MAVFTVHKRPDDPADGVRLVAEGFSLAAAAFTVLWALWRGLWLPALLLFAFTVGLGALAAALGFGEPAIAAAQLIVGVAFGLAAHDIERGDLRRRGFAEIATVAGASEDEAELAYFTGLGPQRSVPAASGSPRPYAPADPLGLFGNV